MVQRQKKPNSDADQELASGLLLDEMEKILAQRRGTPQSKAPRVPGRYAGKIVVGPEFFNPLSDEEIAELTGS